MTHLLHPPPTDRSVVDRAREVLERCRLDPTERAWKPLIHEIAKELAAAEIAMLKNARALIRDNLGGSSQ